MDYLMQEADQHNAESRRSAASKSAGPRGNLRLFFGGSQGSGAVDAMRRAAHSARSGGADVVVGFLWHDQNPAIDTGLAEFPHIPPLIRNRDSAPAHRINVKLLLARRPDVALIDAHLSASAAASRRRQAAALERIWFDIERLLAAGVSVWASLDASGLRSWTLCPECPPLHRWVALPRAVYSDVRHC